MNKPYLLLSFLLAQLLTACTGPYFGYTKEQWGSLTDIEKHAVKQEYQAVLDSRHQQAHATKIIERTESIIDHARKHPENIR